MIDWINRRFPLAAGRYVHTSQRSKKYNCIAWAAGESHISYAPQAGYKWPSNSKTNHIESLISVFAGLGFRQCEHSPSLEPGFRKVALYAKRTIFTHAVRQLPNGRWASKMGINGEDIDVDSPECLCNETYGDVYCYMRAEGEPQLIQPPNPVQGY